MNQQQQQQQQQPRKKKNKSKTPVEFTFHDIDGKSYEETFQEARVITRKLNSYIHPEDVLFRTHRYEFVFEKEKEEREASKNKNNKNNKKKKKPMYIALNLRKIPLKHNTSQTENLPGYLKKQNSEYLMKHSVPALDQDGEGTLIETTFECIQKEKEKKQWKLDLKWVPSSRCKWHNISMPNIPYFLVVSVFEHDSKTGHFLRKSRFRSNLFQIVCKPRVYFNRTTKIWTQEQEERAKRELEEKMNHHHAQQQQQQQQQKEKEENRIEKNKQRETHKKQQKRKRGVWKQIDREEEEEEEDLQQEQPAKRKRIMMPNLPTQWKNVWEQHLQEIEQENPNAYPQQSYPPLQLQQQLQQQQNGTMNLNGGQGEETKNISFEEEEPLKDIYLMGASYSISALPRLSSITTTTNINMTSTMQDIDQWPTPDPSSLQTPDGMMLA